jgi:hypothetical protein
MGAYEEDPREAIGPARSGIIAVVGVVGLDLARDLARAMIWGILFRLPCARFTPGRAYDQRPAGARPVPSLERLFRSPLRLRAGDTPERRGERLNHDR